jgi:hypothetical protein
MTKHHEVHGYRHLNETKVRMIATRYDLDPNSTEVRGNAGQADELHGQPCANFDGDTERFWGCDATGHYDAERLLDGYLDQVTYEVRCDALAAADFEDRAYGGR